MRAEAPPKSDISDGFLERKNLQNVAEKDRRGVGVPSAAQAVMPGERDF
jgi:hypothetical protein